MSQNSENSFTSFFYLIETFVRLREQHRLVQRLRTADPLINDRLWRCSLSLLRKKIP